MNRRFLATAIVVLFAAPQSAWPQSAVTISGFFKASVENLKLGQSAKSPNTEMRVTDESSRIIFNVAEDLGGGLQAIAQLDWRIQLDTGSDGGGALGNNFVGLRSRSWGALTVGRHDLHYNNTPSEVAAKAGSYKAQSLALLSFAGGGGTAVAGGSTRTPNVVRYDSPKWGGLGITAAYSTNAGAAAEADIGSSARKGRAWNLAPIYTASDWQIGWSHWNSKPDAFAAADQNGDRLWGYFTWRGLKLGVAWDRAKLKAGATGVVTSNRTAWAIPLRYQTGNHNFYVEYSGARDDKATANVDGAKMFALAYAYDLSKRTSAGVTFARVRNEAFATYNLYGSAGSQGSPSGAVAAGEDPRIWAIVLRHAF